MYWREALETHLRKLVSGERVGLITDMDGTISPIVSIPSEARPTPHSRKLLAALNQRLALVAVISGRSAVDVARRVELPELIYIGNHGLERWRSGHLEVSPLVEPYLLGLQQAIRALEPRLLPGMIIDDKGATFTIHYRNTRNPEEAAEAFRPLAERAAAEHGLQMFEGRMIFELRPPLNLHKGTAFYELVTEYELDAAVYLGDDTTDADALRMGRQMRDQGVCYSIGIGVEADETPSAVLESADLLASGIPDVEAFLSWLWSASST